MGALPMADIIDFERQTERSKLRSELAQQDAAERIAAIAEMNERHAVITVEGNTCIINFERNPITGHLEHTFSSERHLHLRYRDRQVTSSSGELAPLAREWLKDPARRAYEGLTFRPGHGTVEGHYNLWQGYAVPPDPAGSDACQAFLDLLWRVHCAQDEASYTYVLDWLADLFQNPLQKPGVALVFRGSRGTGKTFLAEMIGHILGPHFVKASQPRHVTGHFNAHLEKAQLLFLEEAIWAGDRQAESVMKDLITGRTLLIERKGLPVYSAPSYLRVIACSNEDFVAPAGPEERRYAVFDVSDDRKQDADYFGELRREMTQNGGAAALLHLLLTREITQDIRCMPKTTALADQKLYHLDNFDRWLLEMLHIGELTVAIANEKGITARQTIAWESAITASSLYDDYCRSLKEANSRSLALNIVHFARQLRRRLHPAGPVRRIKARHGTERIWKVALPPLPACRKAFERYLGQPLDWDT